MSDGLKKKKEIDFVECKKHKWHTKRRGEGSDFFESLEILDVCIYCGIERQDAYF